MSSAALYCRKRKLESESESEPKSDSVAGDVTSPWPRIPPDVLLAIAGLIDIDIAFAILRLRSVCRTWRISLSPPSSSLQFPLKLPLPTSSSSYSHPNPPYHLSLIRRTVYLLTPPDRASNGFVLKVEEVAPNTFSLFDPLTKKKHRKPRSKLDLLSHRVSVVCHSYVIERVDTRDPPFDYGPGFSIRKAVVATGFFEKGDFVVLALSDEGRLFLWRFGDEEWTQIGANDRRFDDVISYKGKFYATADEKGRLVMIDSRLKPMDLVPSLRYGRGLCTHLVECDGDLCLVDRDFHPEGLRVGVFKLDDKGRFWDCEPTLNDGVIFAGNDVNIFVSNKVFAANVRNCVYFLTGVPETDDQGGGIAAVLEMKENTIHPMLESRLFRSLYWPPERWFCLA